MSVGLPSKHPYTVKQVASWAITRWQVITLCTASRTKKFHFVLWCSVWNSFRYKMHPFFWIDWKSDQKSKMGFGPQINKQKTTERLRLQCYAVLLNVTVIQRCMGIKHKHPLISLLLRIRFHIRCGSVWKACKAYFTLSKNANVKANPPFGIT